jgi:hypothetical protein
MTIFKHINYQASKLRSILPEKFEMKKVFSRLHTSSRRSEESVTVFAEADSPEEPSQI